MSLPKKYHKRTVTCSVCKKPREIGLTYALLMERQGTLESNICAKCSRQIARLRELLPDECRVVVRGRVEIRVNAKCKRCGKVRAIRREQDTGYCQGCASHVRNTKHVERLVIGEQPIEAPIYHRCSRGFDGRCSRYEECLDVACEQRWLGWTCADGSKPVRVELWERAELKEFLDMLIASDYDPFESSLGINTCRTAARRY